MSFFRKFFGKKNRAAHESLPSLVDMKKIPVEFNFILGKEKQMLDPLSGAGFDIANLYIENSSTYLESSPFLHVWSDETELKFSGLKGIWLSSKLDNLFIKYEFGRKKHAHHPDWAVFFPVPEHHHGTEAQLVLELTCMN